MCETTTASVKLILRLQAALDSMAQPNGHTLCYASGSSCSMTKIYRVSFSLWMLTMT